MEVLALKVTATTSRGHSVFFSELAQGGYNRWEEKWQDGRKEYSLLSPMLNLILQSYNNIYYLN